MKLMIGSILFSFLQQSLQFLCFGVTLPLDTVSPSGDFLNKITGINIQNKSMNSDIISLYINIPIKKCLSYEILNLTHNYLYIYIYVCMYNSSTNDIEYYLFNHTAKLTYQMSL